MSWTGVFSVFGAVAGFFKWLTGYEQRKAGRIEAERDGLRREAERLNQRGRIEDDVQKASRDDLEAELRGERK